MSFSLASSAILVGIRLTQPKRKIKIKAASDLVRQHFGAGKKSGDFEATLYPTESERPILSIHEECFQVHKRLTCRWEHGIDIITKKGKPKWDDEVRKYVTLFDDAVAKQAEIYDSAILPAAKRELGKLAAECVYPTAEQWAKAWSLRPVVRPVPNSGDLRLTLPKEEIEEVERELREQHRQGVRDVYGRLHGLVQASAQQLSRYGVAKGAKLYEQTVQGHIGDLISALDGLNIPDEDGNKDGDLEDLATEISNVLLSQDFDDLKEDKDLRTKVAKKTSALADKIQGYA